MSIISSIKTIHPAFEINPMEFTVTAATIYNGQYYETKARCCPTDQEFFSPRIGKRIARMRLYLTILKSEKQKARAEWINKRQYYQEVLAFGARNSAEVDPTGAFERNLERAAARYKELQSTYKIVEKNLNDFIASLKKSNAIVKKYRDSLAKPD